MVGARSQDDDEAPPSVRVGHGGAGGAGEQGSLSADPWAKALGVPPTWEPPTWRGPRLRVLRGPESGRCFLLKGHPSDPERGWVLGRGEDVDIDLRRDARVDGQAVDLVRREKGFVLLPLRTAEARVSLNGRELDRGEGRTLVDKDLVGLGATLLLFRE